MIGKILSHYKTIEELGEGAGAPFTKPDREARM
jgi:hypothetical protein